MPTEPLNQSLIDAGTVVPPVETPAPLQNGRAEVLPATPEISPELKPDLNEGPKPPDQADIDYSTTDFSQFLKAAGQEVPEGTKPVEQAKPIEAAKPAEVPAKLSREEVIKDFVPEESRKLFRGASNELFDYVTARLKDAHKKEQEYKDFESKLAEAKKTAPTSYIDHEKAYTLSPRYSELSANIQAGNQIAQYWTEQLIKVEKGEPWKRLVQGQDGQLLVEDKEMEANAQSKVWLQGQIHRVQSLLAEDRNSLSRIETDAAEMGRQLREGLKAAEDKMYDRYKDEKSPQYKIVENNLALIPEALRSSPLAMLLAKSGALNVEMSNYVRRLEKEIETLKGGKAVVRQQGPVTEPSSTITTAKSDVSYADFQAQLR